MRHRLALILSVVSITWFALLPVPAVAQQSCDSLTSLKIPNATITSATTINSPSDFLLPRTGSSGGAGGAGNTPDVPVPFCRVAGFSAPTSDSHIGFEVWLPDAETWNGKFQFVGNGGFTGAIGYPALMIGLKRGYAVASTDTGHTTSDEAWALDHPEKLVDWSYRAVHESTVDSKIVVQSYYGKAPKLSYWNGCSTGGKQGLTEAQRYPDDFDGIVAGAPTNYITHLQAWTIYQSWIALKDGVDAPSYIPPAKYPVLHQAVLDACDAKDGVADGVIEDPTRCHFDPKTIQCQGPDAPTCLTAPQVKTAQLIYAGPKFTDGKQIFPSYALGSELAWGVMAAGPEPAGIGDGFFKFMVFKDPKWDFRTLDVSRDTLKADKDLGSTVNAIDPNLKAFRDHGGKIVMYHGWADQLIAPENSINYYTSVVAAMGGLDKTQQFARLFMVPGMTHCQGGAGPNTFDALGAVEQWRENNVAPVKLIATHSTKGVVDNTRPLYPHPQEAIYKGTGDPTDAANFTCGNPSW